MDGGMDRKQSSFNPFNLFSLSPPELGFRLRLANHRPVVAALSASRLMDEK